MDDKIIPQVPYSGISINCEIPQNINLQLKKYNDHLELSQMDDFMRDGLGILNNLHDLFSNPDSDENKLENDLNQSIQLSEPDLNNKSAHKNGNYSKSLALMMGEKVELSEKIINNKRKNDSLN